MGVVPMLWMVAAVGVGYGWTPDGAGGVEYVIQISPEKFDQAKESGEISSTIAPEVRGSVSRVVVRVGEGRLERITPAELSEPKADGGASSANDPAVAPDDLVAVPIPEIDDSGPAIAIGGARSLAGQIGRNAVESVMKPAPQGGAGPTEDSDQAGGSTFSYPQSVGVGGPPPAAVEEAGTAGDSQQSSPGEALSNRTRQEASGAIDDLRQRAAGWSNEVADRAGNATRDAVRSVLPQDPPSVRGDRAVTATPQGTVDAGASADGRSASGSAMVGAPVGARGDGPSTAPTAERAASPWYTENSPAPERAEAAPESHASNGQPVGGSMRDSTDQPAQQPRAAAGSRGAEGDRPNRSVTGSFGRMPAGFSSSQGTTAQASRGQGQAPSEGDSQTSPRAANASQDSRPAGRSAQPSIQYAQARGGEAQGVEAQEAYQPKTRQPQRQFSSETAAGRAPSADPRTELQTPTARGEKPHEFARRDAETTAPSAEAPDWERESRSAAGPQRGAKTVAAQPVFNGLLLFSFVANVYLAWWLKNLRHEFRELVVAKRVARSGNASA